MRAPAFLILIFAVHLAGGCGPDADEEEPAYCSPAVATRGDDPADLVAGEGRGPSFTPWTDGADVPLVFGFQGGVMVTPVLRVPAAQVDSGDSACFSVTIDNTIEEGAEVSDMEDGFEFVLDGDHYYSAPLPDFLDWTEDALAGNHLVLDIEVGGEGVTGQQMLRVRLSPLPE